MEQTTKVDYASKLRAIMEHFDLGFEDVAKMAGVTDQAIRNVVAGNTKAPNANLVGAISKKLGVSADWLLNDEGPMIKDQPIDSVTTIKKGSVGEFWEELKTTYENQIAEYRRREVWYQEQLSKQLAA